MNRRIFTRLVPALATLAVIPRAGATHPTSAVCAAPVDPKLTKWPVWNRPLDPPSIPSDVTTVSLPQEDLWNSFGEFQTRNNGLQDFLHSGIDINGDFFDDYGSWVVAAADSYIWAVMNMASDACLSDDLCKLYLKSADNRYVYYYAHLRLHGPPDKNSAEVDSQVRAKIRAAADYTGPDMPQSIYDAAVIPAGRVLANLAPFPKTTTHLHFGVHDACQNYDGLSPLSHMKPPYFLDETEPRIHDLHVLQSGSVEVTDKCAPIVGDLRIIADTQDTWNPDPPSNHYGTDELGIHRGTYRLTNLSAQDDPDPVEWYHFDMIPFRCAGPDRGSSCTEMAALVDQADFIEELKLEFAPENEDHAPSGGPQLGHTFTTEALFSVTAPFKSNSLGASQNFAILNNTWGEVQPIALDDLADGLYQVVAEVFDTRGLAAAKARFFVVGDTAPLGNLVIRDNETDEGAIPSNAGGKEHWRSPNLRVGGPAPLPTDPVWSSPPQVIDVPVGVPTQVHVLIENQGCDDIEGYTVKVGTAVASLISAHWQEIGEVTRADTIAAGSASVVSFDWTPTAAQEGHSCLLAAVQADGDPTRVPHPGGDIDFEALDVPTDDIVPLDSNLGQRNLTVSNTEQFKLGNPFATTIDLGIEVDCGDVPLKVPGARVSLMVPDDAIFDAWAESPLVTTLYFQDHKLLTFNACKFELPAITVPADTEVDARLAVFLPPEHHGSWDVHLGAKVNGILRDGISVRHTQ